MMESSSSSSSKLSPSPSSSFSSPPSSSSSSSAASSSSLPASNYAPNRSGMSGQQQDVARGRLPRRWVLRNPFVFRVGTTMTGVGVGCGVGIGVGRPINLAALPAVGPALGGGVSSIQGSLSGVSWQVQKAVNLLGGKLGVKGLKAGIGCGVGIGYGFGVGLALKPGVGEEILNTLKDGVASLTEYVMTKWGPQDENRSEKAQQILSGMLLQGRAFGQQQGSAVSSHVAGTAWPNREATTSSSPFVSAVAGQEASRAHKLSAQPPSLTQTAGGTAGLKLGGDDNRSKDGRQSRKHGEQDDMPSRMRVEVDRLQSENEQLRALLRHENEIAALRDENAALKRILTEVLDVEVDGFRTLSSGGQTDMVLSRLRCFECRRRRRRR